MWRQRATFLALNTFLVLGFCLGRTFPARSAQRSPGSANDSVSAAFTQAARESGVPVSLLEAICYMEGRLSNHNGTPSIDNGFGCMHLVQNKHGDTLGLAASRLHMGINQLKLDLAANIRGGAAVLRADALQLSGNHHLPTNLAGWYGAVAMYSEATTRSTALMYANAVYQLLHQGFSAEADDAETIILMPEAVHPNITSADAVKGLGSAALPTGCTRDTHVDYPDAIDCILPAQTFDCNKVQTNAPCNYESANRPVDYAIDQIVIHDIEGNALSSLNVFQDANSSSSVHYIVGSDGTVYQVVRDKDIAYHAGNYWYNQHSIGIEHAGYDVDGYKWYNATEYLASAKLVAYLLKNYHLPLDHAHIVSHGTVPSPNATDLPNHVDPGPYWLWDYYFKLIHQQGIPYPKLSRTAQILALHPKSARQPDGKQGKESSANFSFFFLYTGPSTKSGRIPRQNISSDITDVTDNVESDTSYYYLTKEKDRGGSGDMMYQIWYGQEDQVHAKTPSRSAHAKLCWLAVPSGAASEEGGTLVMLTTSDGSTPQIYGQPTTGSQDIIGSAPVQSVFVSEYTLVEDGTTNQWSEIDYNHRQAWIPASEVTIIDKSPMKP